MSRRRPSLEIEMRDMRDFRRMNHLTLIPEYESQQQFKVAISYTCHMHPITQLTLPDFMDRDKSSLIDIACTVLYAMLPMILNFFLTFAASLTNVILLARTA